LISSPYGAFRKNESPNIFFFKSKRWVVGWGEQSGAWTWRGVWGGNPNKKVASCIDKNRYIFKLMAKITIISPNRIKGYNTILIDWKYKTLTDLVNEVRPQIKSKILGGYSIGGAVALILAQELNLTKLVLYSPTPLFREEIAKAPQSELKFLGKKRVADIQNYSLQSLNKKVKTIIYIGEHEGKPMIDFAKKLNKRLNSSLIIKRGCDHNAV